MAGLALARPLGSLAAKDAVLAMIGPAALLGQLACFLGLFLIGYAVALWPYAASLPGAVDLAAAHLFTGGLAHVSGRGNAAIEVLAGVTGAVAIALLAVLDAAALHLALIPSRAPSEGRFCIRMGFTALRRLAELLGWSYDPDPLPEAEIALSFEEFARAVALFESAGLPLERTAEEAWPHFRGWRVNYESLAYRLAEWVLAPRAPWSGERRHLALALEMPRRPPHRSPGQAPSESASSLPRA